MGVLIEFGGLARSIICEEKKSARSVLLEQNHSKRRASRSICGGQRHSISVTNRLDRFLFEPDSKLLERIGMGLIAIDGLVGKVIIGAWNV